MKKIRHLASLCAALLALSLLGPVTGSHARSRQGQYTRDLKCDATWDVAYGFVESFCKAEIYEGELEQIEELVRNGDLSAWSLEVLLNTYGAMYGYEFKKLKHLNTFFYGKDAANWLPPACVPLIKSKTANKMPLELTKVRDSLRRVYDAHFKAPGKKSP